MANLTREMKDISFNNSFGFRPKAETCCNACVFGTGEHAGWCPVAQEWFHRIGQFFFEHELPKAGRGATRTPYAQSIVDDLGSMLFAGYLARR